MDAIFPYAVTFAMSVLTVLVTDSIRLRRDRKKKIMDLDWDIQLFKWEALNSAHKSCPQIGGIGVGLSGEQALLVSIEELCVWSATEVEPWLDSESSSEIEAVRKAIERWLNETKIACLKDPSYGCEVPTDQINVLRSTALKQIQASIAMANKRFAQISEDSSL